MLLTLSRSTSPTPPGYLGWRRDEFRRIAAERDLTPDDYNRVGKAELDALTDDEDLAEQLRVDRLLTTQQAVLSGVRSRPRSPWPRDSSESG